MAKSTKAIKAKRTEDYEIAEGVFLTCYEWSDRMSAKITLADSFVIYCGILENNDEEHFLAYPSYKTKKGDWQRTAYCFDKKLIKKLDEAVADFCGD